MKRPGGTPVERLRDERPASEEWRADAMAASRHSRLLDELRLPQAEGGPEAAARLCAEVCRNSLRDLAPALILLPPAQRRRAQALAAYTLVLFDFARQTGLEGERLSQINRWQFHLEEALSGAAAGQPIFLRLQLEEQSRPWDREALDGLSDAARHRVAVRRPATEEARTAELERLATALAAALLGTAEPAATGLAMGLLRLFSLLDLDEGLRRHDARLPRRGLPDDWATAGDPDRRTVAAAVRRECELAGRQLGSVRFAELPRAWRPAARFLALAGRGLLRRIERAGPSIVEQAPRLGVGARLGLLLRARWL
jgi:phytoene/squalene synthetase